MEDENVTIEFRQAYTDKIDGEMSLAEFKSIYPHAPAPTPKWQRVTGGIYQEGYFARVKTFKHKKV